jgi:acetyltransferase (GNAT) family protein
MVRRYLLRRPELAIMLTNEAASIAIAETDADIFATHPLICQLHPQIRLISETEYLERVRCQQAEIGFQLAVLKDKGEVVCVAGFRLCSSLGWGRFLYVDDLVTNENRRSEGADKAMLAWLAEQARALLCGLRLDCALHHQEAHRFYLRERMHCT